MSEKIVVCLEKGGARDMAEAFSRRTNTPIAEEALKKSTEPWFVEHVYCKLIEKM